MLFFKKCHVFTKLLLNFEVKCILNKNTVQLQHLFSLLNIGINKIVKSFFQFVCFSVISSVDQFQFDLGLHNLKGK